ncbi:MAG TPA: GAF domain-containing protein [Terriglobales bacterium]
MASKEITGMAGGAVLEQAPLTISAKTPEHSGANSPRQTSRKSGQVPLALRELRHHLAEDAGALRSRTPDGTCAEIAKVFGVAQTEVSLLIVQGRFLKFSYPFELRSAGLIPLSSPAIAARTVQTTKAERFNNFANIKHVSVFELIRLGKGESCSRVDCGQPIQKLMSAPLVNEKKETLGVVQVCRKGADLASAGPDFTSEDLHLLERAAEMVGNLVPDISLWLGE